jgi:hypothetical protein
MHPRKAAVMRRHPPAGGISRHWSCNPEILRMITRRLCCGSASRKMASAWSNWCYSRAAAPPASRRLENGIVCRPALRPARPRIRRFPLPAGRSNKKAGQCPAFKFPMPFVAPLGRARTMIGLFYFPQARIAFVQHSSREPAPTLALMMEIAKINVSQKQQTLPRRRAAGSPEKFEYPCR